MVDLEIVEIVEDVFTSVIFTRNSIKRKGGEIMIYLIYADI